MLFVFLHYFFKYICAATGFYGAEYYSPINNRAENNIENRRRPERWRSGFGISVLPAVRFVPFDKGTAFAGANCRG